ncbi:hypothetical protein [Rhizobium sp. AN80A]|uniref:hypothetical protein n=1 Tax=Rhizobium sp. AN80A TaxID=3040673 RepID=UPI000DDB40C7|nr:hypothetical protein [Rhizobium sp. AN80A]
MRITTLASIAALSLALAASPLAVAGFDIAAMAKGGNGGGNGGGSGGNGNGGGGHGNSGSQGSSSTHGNSQSQGNAARGKSGEAVGQSQSRKAERTPAVTTKQRKASAELAGLNSLNRSFKAYLHTSDPRMTAISAYAVAYAQYELDNGVEPSEDDPILGDQALKDALASATKTGEVSAAALEKAKSILGVGEAEGKIDQIKATLTPTKSTEDADPAVVRSN